MHIDAAGHTKQHRQKLYLDLDIQSINFPWILPTPGSQADPNPTIPPATGWDPLSLQESALPDASSSGVKGIINYEKLISLEICGKVLTAFLVFQCLFNVLCLHCPPKKLS